MMIYEQDMEAARQEEEKNAAYMRRAKAYLKALSRMETRFESRCRYRARLMAMAEGISARPLGTMSSGNPNGREVILAELTDLDMDLAREMKHIQAARNETWDLFARLSHPKAGLILESVYLCGETCLTAARKAGFAERYTYHIRDTALAELGKLLEDDGIVDPK